MSDTLMLTNPDGSKFQIEPDIRSVRPLSAKNINAKSMVMTKDATYLAVESPEEVQKMVRELTYTKPPPPNIVKGVANKYGMVLANMENWKATFIFGTEKDLSVTENLDPENLEDSVSKCHMQLTRQYRALNRSIPYLRSMVAIEQKGNCHGCGR